MQKRIPFILLFLLILSSRQSIAQTWNWGVNTGSTIMGQTSANKTATAPNGDVYVLGDKIGSVNFGGAPLTEFGLGDIYLARYTSGGQLIWVRTLGGPEHEYPLGLSTDGAGNAYIAFDYESELITVNGTAYTNAGGDTIITGVDHFIDGLVAKINPAGEWQWAIRIGGLENDYLGDLVTDVNGNTYVGLRYGSPIAIHLRG